MNIKSRSLHGPRRPCVRPLGTEGMEVHFKFGAKKIWLEENILSRKKPAGVFSPKLSRILLEKGAVPPAWINKFEPIVTQDPMTIRKYLGKESNSKRCVPIKCVPIPTLAGSRTSRLILPRAQIATSTHAHGESDEKKRQAGVNK
ncbi:hypothetical protein AVEN_106695-1 [Araneus ventricosus]|uniref:Uncharacterized protein n=1 Tax=Araneus ventricosus TaxID=182803 RepID=A0A4Y2EN18_ARAVE|nr:hypothetical protein AVEN_106695-1 [Araneus ventricosus]